MAERLHKFISERRRDIVNTIEEKAEGVNGLVESKNDEVDIHPSMEEKFAMGNDEDKMDETEIKNESFEFEIVNVHEEKYVPEKYVPEKYEPQKKYVCEHPEAIHTYRMVLRKSEI